MGTASKSRKPSGKAKVHISVDKARDTLGDLVNRANAGDERFLVTRHGLPAAAIVSLDDLRALEASDAA